ncbi:M48 family metallopeptidase [bacterium]|nr:M48 family metallopeptidase [bacterium]
MNLPLPFSSQNRKSFLFSHRTVIFLLGTSLMVLSSCLSGGAPYQPRDSALPNSRLATHLAEQETVRTLAERCPQVETEEILAPLRRVTHRLISSDRTTGRHLTPTIQLLSCRAPFAFTRTNGTVVLSLGILRRTRSEAALAFLLAHEFGHLALGHLEQTREGLTTELETDRRREEELAADRYALRQLIAAHYDPWAATEIFLDPLLLSHREPTRRNEGNRSHPGQDERAREITTLLRGAQWKGPGTVSSRTFLRLQRAVSALL